MFQRWRVWQAYAVIPFVDSEGLVSYPEWYAWAVKATDVILPYFDRDRS